MNQVYCLYLYFVDFFQILKWHWGFNKVEFSPLSFAASHNEQLEIELRIDVEFTIPGQADCTT